RPIGSTLRDTRAYLARLSAARTSAMTERGSLRMFGRPRPRHWLTAHEKSPGHTLRQHVGLSDARLLKRLQDDPRKMNASTFASRDRAERLIDDLLQSERRTLEAWLEGSQRSLRLDGTLPTVTGRSAFRDGHFEFVSGIRVVILRDSKMPEGFHILTSFPQP
ncbi:MAG: RNase A-like domain-containing protein, partial [Nocardioides sp.]